MGFWLLLIGTVLALFAAGVLYIAFRAAHFPAVQHLAGGRRRLARVMCLTGFLVVVTLPPPTVP